MRRKPIYDTLLDEELLDALGQDPRMRLVPWTFDQARGRVHILELVQVTDEAGGQEVQVVPTDFTNPRFRH